MKKTTIKVLICNETGKIYNNLKEAQQLTGNQYTAISHQLAGRRKTAGGFTFRKIDLSIIIQDILGDKV